jgi:hypothetical protein
MEYYGKYHYKYIKRVLLEDVEKKNGKDNLQMAHLDALAR